MIHVTPSLIDFLVFKGVIDEDQKKIIEIESVKKNLTIDQCIAEMSFVSANTLSRLINEFNNEEMDLANFIVDVELIKLIPYNLCIAKHCIPIALVNNCLYIGMSRYDINTIQELGSCVSFSKTKIIKADNKQIYDLIQKYYAYTENWIDVLEVSENNAEVFIDRILLDAVNKKASDIHLSCEDRIIRVRYRIDGELVKVCIFHKDHFSKVSMRLKILFGVDISKSFQGRDGSLSKFILGNKVDFRISFHNCIYGENIVIRILSNLHELNLYNLGYSENILSNIKRMIESYGGMVIFIGPTGSGKTTALYSALQEIDASRYNIMTVEDPVEYNLRGIQQTDVNYHPDMTFSSCLRSILRQDPDVILIGEIRDAETAHMALRAAMTGHKVFTTLHARNIFGVLDRIQELGLPKVLATTNIKGVVAQRLLKKLCNKCYGKKCAACHNTGHSGRCVVGESLFFDDDIIDIMLSDSKLEEKKHRLREKNYVSILEDAMTKVSLGLVSKDQLNYGLDGIC